MSGFRSRVFTKSIFRKSVPESWKLVNLGAVVDHCQYGTSEPNAQDGCVFIVGMKELQSGYIKTENLLRVNVTDAELESLRLRKGDVLVNRTNSPDLVGKSAIFSADISSVYASYLVRLSINIDEADSRFVNYWLNSYIAQVALKRISTRAISQANINPTEMRAHCPLPLPPLPEQRKIAEILRTWDEAIEKLEALLVRYQKRRTWLRTHLISGEIRLPGHSVQWRSGRLSDVLTEHGLKATGEEEVYSVSVHKGLVNQVEHLGRSFAAAETGHYNRVLSGDIVYTKSPTGEFPLGIIKQSKLNHEVIVSPLYGVFRPVSPDLGVILDALFESPIAVGNYLRPLVQKGAKNTIAITNSRFLEGKLTLPVDPAEQAAIADVLSKSRREIAFIEENIALLKQQKRGLMQKLLTGEWRVTPEAPVA